MTTLLLGVIYVGYAVWLTVWLTAHGLPALEAKWRAETLAANQRNSVRNRLASVAEREMRLREQQAAQPKLPTAMPGDLLARINSWEDDFAKDDERRAINELYADLGDWQLVRTALPALNVPAVDLDLRMAS